VCLTVVQRIWDGIHRTECSREEWRTVPWLSSRRYENVPTRDFKGVQMRKFICLTFRLTGFAGRTEDRSLSGWLPFKQEKD
jgi:hypothetical protein